MGQLAIPTGTTSCREQGRGKERTHSELVKGTGLLDVLEGRRQVRQLGLDLGGSLLGRRDLQEEAGGNESQQTVVRERRDGDAPRRPPRPDRPAAQPAREAHPADDSHRSRLHGCRRPSRTAPADCTARSEPCRPRPARSPPSSSPGRPRSPLPEGGDATHGLGLEGSDSLELGLDVVVDGLEALEELLALGDDLLVLEDGAVVLKVDGGLLLLDGGVGGTGGGGTRAERVQLGERLCGRCRRRRRRWEGSATARPGLDKGADAPRPRPSLEVMRVQSTAAAAMVGTSSGEGDRGGERGRATRQLCDSPARLARRRSRRALARTVLLVRA